MSFMSSSTGVRAAFLEPLAGVFPAGSGFPAADVASVAAGSEEAGARREHAGEGLQEGRADAG